MRAEHIYPYDSGFNRTQFYLACAHLDIKGSGGGKPGPLVKFPGAYDLFDRGEFVLVIHARVHILTMILQSGIWVPFRHSSDQYTDLSDYQPPGPPVWKG